MVTIMKFIDTAKIKLAAGKGGNGCVSFRREKYAPKGGPDGGNGGVGANIYFVGDRAKHTLMDFRYRPVYKAPDGEKGSGNNRHGAGGEDLIIPVPLGTIVINAKTKQIIADIIHEDKPILIAQGGRGGKGNTCFATPEQRAPRVSEEGTPGREMEVELELKLIADAGIIGFPNAGKSTFISVVSAAKPKIADYPFTTLTPNLCVVQIGPSGGIVLADMPGLIDNAHLGAGLGQQFLKHIERTKLLVHFVDSSAETPMSGRYEAIRRELNLYQNSLTDKPEVIAATKFDSVNKTSYDEFLKYADKNNLKVFPVSAVTHYGVKELITEIANRLTE